MGKWKSTEHLTNQTHGNLAYISLPRIIVGLDKLIYFDVLIGTVCVASSIINIFVRVDFALESNKLVSMGSSRKIFGIPGSAHGLALRSPFNALHHPHKDKKLVGSGSVSPSTLSQEAC